MEKAPRNRIPLLLVIAAVVAVVAVMLVTGWADDKAPAGSKGRVPVTTTP